MGLLYSLAVLTFLFNMHEHRAKTTFRESSRHLYRFSHKFDNTRIPDQKKIKTTGHKNLNSQQPHSHVFSVNLLIWNHCVCEVTHEANGGKKKKHQMWQRVLKQQSRRTQQGQNRARREINFTCCTEYSVRSLVLSFSVLHTMSDHR